MQFALEYLVHMFRSYPNALGPSKTDSTVCEGDDLSYPSEPSVDMMVADNNIRVFAARGRMFLSTVDLPNG